MSTRTSNVPAVLKLAENPILTGSHVVETIVGLLAIDEPLAPTLAVEDISNLDQEACLDRAGRAFAGLRSLGRLSSLQVWVAGQSLSRARDLAKHGTWIKTLEEHDLAEATVRQAIRVFKKYPDPALLPPSITQTKIDADIVKPRPPKGAVKGGDPIEAGSKSVEPDRSPSSMPGGRQPLDQGGDSLEHGKDVEGLNDVQDDAEIQGGDVENLGEDQGGDVQLGGEPEAKVAKGTTGPKWFDGQPAGDIGRGYTWQVLTAGEDVRVVWAPVAKEAENYLFTTTGVRLAHEEGIYRTRRDALLGASALLTEEVERLKADLDDASRSLTKVLDLVGEE